MTDALTLAKKLSATGLSYPVYKRPKWYQWRKRAYIRWMDKHGLKYRLENRTNGK